MSVGNRLEAGAAWQVEFEAVMVLPKITQNNGIYRYSNFVEKAPHW